ncbi:Salicyloyl-CoA 5-hydroxylase [Streptomyces sp. RB17]|uniref:FAD-dependent monooxygenase n=1 Tax=Streptomyces sp. RB17 TaxID=2585197 RepID=UPI00130B02BD|nr:FAD-dependent monooxygenase [Streptomyces sp. RB17]MQY33697.1 Salicyloyl-CoA 5-hydroxylase [Streptomyces sp. RB17]
MRIAVIGAGPGGLYTACLVKRLRPQDVVEVWEADAAGDTFGFGVVFSDGALGGIEAADPVLFAAVTAEFARWTRIDVHYRGRTQHNEGYGFAAIGRHTLLRLLRERCAGLGVRLHFGTPAPLVSRLRAAYDLVVAADGVGSQTRARHPAAFGTERRTAGARYMWLGTDRPFDALTFAVVETEHGPMQAHAYPYADGRGTFIVEVGDAVWHAAGFEAAERRSGEAAGDGRSIARVAEFFSELLDGHGLWGNRSYWGRFVAVRNRSWNHGNLVLLGDSAHTTHFSIGSGTKLAMEDALALATALHDHRELPEALAAYQDERRPAVERMQRTALTSLEWFENIDRCVGLPPEAFNAHLLTRSGRLSRDDLPAVDPERVGRIRRRFADAA